jgi:hypothetical protein
MSLKTRLSQGALLLTVSQETLVFKQSEGGTTKPLPPIKEFGALGVTASSEGIDGCPTFAKLAPACRGAYVGRK